MAFDDIVLVVVGLGCACYLANKVKNAMRGDPGCSGCSGCQSGKSSGCPSSQETGKSKVQ